MLFSSAVSSGCGCLATLAVPGFYPGAFAGDEAWPGPNPRQGAFPPLAVQQARTGKGREEGTGRLDVWDIGVTGLFVRGT